MVEYDLDQLSIAVLYAISLDKSNPKEIASLLNVDVNDVKKVIEELKAKGLVKEVEEGFWIFKTKKYVLTREGYNTLKEALKHLQPKIEEAKKIMIERGEDAALEFLTLAGLGLLAPLLLMSLTLPMFNVFGPMETEHDVDHDIDLF